MRRGCARRCTSELVQLSAKHYHVASCDQWRTVMQELVKLSGKYTPIRQYLNYGALQAPLPHPPLRPLRPPPLPQRAHPA